MGKDFCKLGKGAVVGLFRLGRKNAGGKLIKFKVIGNTFAAFALLRAGLIGAGAFYFIVLNLAFH